MRLRTVCLVAGGFNRGNTRLQPWRYLLEVARGLAAQGHPVLLITDGQPGAEWVESVHVHRLASLRNLPLGSNPDLLQLLRLGRPEVILLHIGLLSFLYQDFNFSTGARQVGIFTSPIYSFNELFRLGLLRLLRKLPLTGAHLLGSCLPSWYLRRRLARSRFDRLVVQTQTTCRQLERIGVYSPPIAVVPPGVDPEWIVDSAAPNFHPPPEDRVVFVFYGPAGQLRGLDTLLTAFTAACAHNPSLHLEVLVRRDPGADPRKPVSREKDLAGLPRPSIQIETDPLSAVELAARVSAAEVVALPFELVSSDAPLSLVEAAALGVPLVTTTVACLPELASPVPHFLASPADPLSLAQALLQAAEYVRKEREQPLSPLPLAAAPQARTWERVGVEWSALVQSL